MSLLIKEVQIVDGEGLAPYKADVLVQKNLISAIGNLKGKDADLVIDGLGNYLTPGFIDVNATSDHYLTLFTNPRQTDFTAQGVTTILGGHCGSSLAPLLYGTLESIRKWADPHSINVNWHTTREFLSSLDKLPLGVNFGTLAGHGTVKRALVGDEDRDLTLKELWVFKKVLSRALDEGAFGLSTGLEYLHSRSTSIREIRELVGLLKKVHGIYTTHLRSETEGILGSIEETLKIAKDTGIKTVVSHFRPINGFENQFSQALEVIKNNSATANLHFDVYPYDTSVLPIYMILPKWVQEENLEKTLENLRHKENVKKIVKELKDLNPEDLKIATADKADYFIGKTLSQIIAGTDLSPAEGLLKVMAITKMKATVFYRNINSEMLLQTMKEDRAFISSNGNSLPDTPKCLKHDRSTNTFPKFLEIVMGNKLFPIETAVKKITSVPASFLDLKGRGVVKEGKVADLVLLGKTDYQVKETVLGGKRMELGGRGEVLRRK